LDKSFSSDFFGQFARLTVSANIAPDERWTNDSTAVVEHDCTMHLSGEPNTCNVVPLQPGALKGTRNGNLTRSPPIIGMLLGPANLR